MTVDDLVKVLGATAAAVAVVLGAMGALYAKLIEYRKEVNGRMGRLLELTHTSGVAAGQLDGRDAASAAERAELMAYQAGKAAGIAQATAMKRWISGVAADPPTANGIASGPHDDTARVESPGPHGIT